MDGVTGYIARAFSTFLLVTVVMTAVDKDVSTTWLVLLLLVTVTHSMVHEAMGRELGKKVMKRVSEHKFAILMSTLPKDTQDEVTQALQRLIREEGSVK